MNGKLIAKFEDGSPMAFAVFDAKSIKEVLGEDTEHVINTMTRDLGSDAGVAVAYVGIKKWKDSDHDCSGIIATFLARFSNEQQIPNLFMVAWVMRYGEENARNDIKRMGEELNPFGSIDNTLN